MAKLLSPGDKHVVIPHDQRNKPDGERITYTLRTPKLYDQVRLDRAIAVAGGASHGMIDMLRALKRGVEIIMADSPQEARDGVMSLIDGYRNDLSEFHEMVLAGDLEEDGGKSSNGVEGGIAEALEKINAGSIDIAEIERQIAASYRPYAAMVADNAVYEQIAGIESARLFVVGWTGEELGELKRTSNGATEECLMVIPPGHRFEIRQAVQRLMRPTKDEEKNSLSPPSSRSSEKTSTVAKTQAQTAH